MKNYLKIMLGAAIAAAPLCADDSFDGIGIAITQEDEGAEVVYVIPETPAAKAKVKAGDIILTVDGISLKDKSIDESRELLRGIKNKPISITYLSDGETYSETLRRTHITVRDVENEAVKAKVGKKEKLGQKEIKSLSSEKNKQLVAILQNGSVIKENENVLAEEFSTVYLDQEDFGSSGSMQKNATKPAQAVLQSFSRSSIGYFVKSFGNVTISIINSDGAVEAKFLVRNVSAGSHVLNWDSTKLTKDHYLVTLECNGTISGKNVILK